MLRLVRVTPQDVEILFQLVCFNNPTDKQDLMAGLVQMSRHFAQTSDKYARLVLPPNLFSQLVALIECPWMPADAKVWGMPQEVYIEMAVRMPAIREAFSVPDLVDFNFLNVPVATSTNSRYVN